MAGKMAAIPKHKKPEREAAKTYEVNANEWWNTRELVGKKLHYELIRGSWELTPGSLVVARKKREETQRIHYLGAKVLPGGEEAAIFIYTTETTKEKHAKTHVSQNTFELRKGETLVLGRTSMTLKRIMDDEGKIELYVSRKRS